MIKRILAWFTFVVALISAVFELVYGGASGIPVDIRPIYDVLRIVWSLSASVIVGIVMISG